jgi:tripartite ATP-independent transporter DctP family solute receptor
MSKLMGQEIQRRLPGRVDWQVFEGGQLGTESETVEGLMQGTHMIGMDGGWFQNIEPDFALFDTPFLFKNRDQARRVIASVQDDLARVILKKGIVLIGIGDLGFRQISNNVRPIVTPADLRGIKLRTPGNPYTIQTFSTLGANPTPMDAGLLYLALREGVVDGQENPLATIWSFKYHEVQKYISLSNHVFSPIFVGVSARYWNSWPPDVQNAVRQAAQVACDYSFEQDASSEKTLKARIQAANPQIRFNAVDSVAFEKAAAPLIEARRQKIDPAIWDHAMAALEPYKVVARKNS